MQRLPIRSDTSAVSIVPVPGRGVEQAAVDDADLSGKFLLGLSAASQKKLYLEGMP